MRYLRQHPLLAKPAPFLPQWFLNKCTQNQQMNEFLCDGRVGAQGEAEAAALLAQGPAGGEMLSHKDGAGCLHPAHVATSSQGWLLEKGSPLNSQRKACMPSDHVLLFLLPRLPC